MKVKILGCGSSTGVPALGIGYNLCDPKNPKNNRTRASILIEGDDGKNILVDTGPDIREQLLRVGNPLIDAVIITHTHYDHIAGFDELRFLSYVKEDPIAVYCFPSAEEGIMRQAGYMFSNAYIEKHVVKPMKPFKIGQTEILPINQYHGSLQSMGLRIGNFAYSTDVKKMDDEGFEALKGLDTWIFGLVCMYGSHAHADCREFLRWEQMLKPKKVILTHMDSEMDYETLSKIMPPHIRPGFDGMEITIEKENERQKTFIKSLQEKKEIGF